MANAMGPSTPDDSLTAELDRRCDGSRLADLGLLDDAEVAGLVADLTTLEREVSQRRSATFQRLDALSAEITRRYRTGEASVETSSAASSRALRRTDRSLGGCRVRHRP